MMQWFIPEWSQAALILALTVALLQVILLALALKHQQWRWIHGACGLSTWMLIGTSVAVIGLVGCFVTNNFAVIYVAEHSNRHLPLFYRLTAFWGAHEGSVLLWVWMLSAWHFAFSRSQALPLKPLAGTLLIMAAVFIGFVVFLLMTSNPFLIGLPPYVKDGADLNPLLQDPGLVIHPPILYAGYVGFVVPFSFAITTLFQKISTRQWAAFLRPWALMSWAFLSVGIVLGSWWSYHQLGWGGWWFWDPVENASLMPWLIGAALLHGLLAVQKRGVLKGWTICLAMLAFILSVMGTFLVRSGVLISVHAFAVDPSRGRYLLLFLLVLVLLSYGLYCWRSRELHDAKPMYLCSRESALMLNMALLLAATATVLLGTLYPLILQVLSLGKISVGVPYFNAVFAPIMLPLLFAMGWAPDLAWRRDQISRLVSARLRLFGLSALSVPVTMFWMHVSWWAALGIAFAAWIVINTLAYAWRERQMWRGFSGGCRFGAMIIAHLGMALLLVGVVVASSMSQQLDVSMAPGDQTTLAGYQFTFKQLNGIRGPNYIGDQATIVVRKGLQTQLNLKPEIRMYTASHISNPKAGIHPGWFQDIYATLAQPLDKHHWAIRLYIKPMVRWIWLGGLLMALGAIMAVLGRERHHLVK